jgi:putative transposase
LPRRPRVFIEGGIYHVYNRFARGAHLFSEDNEAERFVELLKKVRERDGLTVFAWCVMSNHYHVAVRVGPVPLWRTFGFVQARFGQDHNRRRRLRGPLWQCRFSARLVEDQNYLDQLIAYVHLNPVSAGLVDDPADYPLSGHREILSNERAGLVDVDGILMAFGGTLRTARRRYVRALAGAREEDWRTELPGRLPWWKREPDRPLKAESTRVWVDERGRSTGPERARVDAKRFLEATCRALGMTPQRLSGRLSDCTVSRARCMVVSLGVERWEQSSKQLGSLLGRRADVVSRWVRWGGERRQTDDSFRREYETLDAVLGEHLEREDEGGHEGCQSVGPGTLREVRQQHS